MNDPDRTDRCQPTQATSRSGRPVPLGRAVLALLALWTAFAALAALTCAQWKECWLLGAALACGGILFVHVIGSDRSALWLAAFLVGAALVRIWYLAAVRVDLSGDEAQYWDWSRNMDWCFFSKGPGVAACIWVTRRLLGDTVLGVRAGATILSFLSSLVLYALGVRLKDRRTGLQAAALFQVVPIYAFCGVGITTDPPLIFLWLVAMLLFHRVWTCPSWAGWILLGGAVGLGVLTKYTMALFCLPAFILLLVHPAGRRQLRGPMPYAGVLVSLLLVLPLLIWNSQHGWANVLHNAGHTKLQAGLRASSVNFGLFVGGQLGVVTPLLLIFMTWALIRRRREDPFSFCFAIPLMGLFLLKSVQGEVLTNWALVCYLPGLIAFCAYYGQGLARFNVHVRRLVRAGLAIAVVGSIALHAVILIPFPRTLDPLKKIRRGAVEVGRDVSAVAATLPPNRFILSDNYALSSLLAFYVEGQPRTYCVNLGRRFNQFDFWPTFHHLRHYDAILVLSGDLPMPPELEERFASWEKRPLVVRTPRPKEYSIFICRDFQGMPVVLPSKYN